MSCTSHMQRCSEQMVLLAKAYSILDAALRPYVFDQALTNTEPSQELEKGLKKKSSYEGLDWDSIGGGGDKLPNFLQWNWRPSCYKGHVLKKQGMFRRCWNTCLKKRLHRYVCVVMSCGASHDSTHMLQTGLCGKASIFGSFGQSE